MKRFFALFAIIVFIFLSLINCSEDEVTNPDSGGNVPTVIITNPAESESFVVGDTITFTGRGEDQGGTSLPDSMLVWTSDHDDTIGAGTSFDNDTLTVNTHIITLTGTDSEGRTGSGSITIEVTLATGFVPIPAGPFMMGSPVDEPERDDDETQHQVTLTRAFCMLSTEVTNQQYAEMAQWAYNQTTPLVTATTISLQDALDGSTEELLNLNGDCEISFNGSTFTVDSGKEEILLWM